MAEHYRSQNTEFWSPVSSQQLACEWVCVLHITSTLRPWWCERSLSNPSHVLTNRSQQASTKWLLTCKKADIVPWTHLWSAASPPLHWHIHCCLVRDTPVTMTPQVKFSENPTIKVHVGILSTRCVVPIGAWDNIPRSYTQDHSLSVFWEKTDNRRAWKSMHTVCASYNLMLLKIRQ